MRETVASIWGTPSYLLALMKVMLGLFSGVPHGKELREPLVKGQWGTKTLHLLTLRMESCQQSLKSGCKQITPQQSLQRTPQPWWIAWLQPCGRCGSEASSQLFPASRPTGPMRWYMRVGAIYSVAIDKLHKLQVKETHHKPISTVKECLTICNRNPRVGETSVWVESEA